MDVVPARGEFLAQLRCDHSGAAISGITSYADAHEIAGAFF
jgi:hypothetical protein